jgi:hypothetical protein
MYMQNDMSTEASTIHRTQSLDSNVFSYISLFFNLLTLGFSPKIILGNSNQIESFVFQIKIKEVLC